MSTKESGLKHTARRRAVYFDLNTNKLNSTHPSGVYRRAYSDISLFMKRNGFNHQQWSGYESIRPMTEVEVLLLVKKLRDTFPWLKGCVHSFVITNVPHKYDYTDVFAADAPTALSITEQEPIELINSVQDYLDNIFSCETSVSNVNKDKVAEAEIEK